MLRACNAICCCWSGMELVVAGNHGNKLWLHTRSTAADGIACSQHEVKNVCLRKTSVFSLFLYLGLLVSSTQGARAQGWLSIWVRVYVLTYEMGKNTFLLVTIIITRIVWLHWAVIASLDLLLVYACVQIYLQSTTYTWTMSCTINFAAAVVLGPIWLHVSVVLLNKNVLVFKELEQGDCMSDKEWCLHNQRHYVIRIFPLKYYLLNN